MKSAEERFWSKVVKGEGCWLWRGSLNNKGYGLFNLSREAGLVLAHRHSYAESRGPIPEGLLVMHSCDEPRCVRPEHLALGTIADNQADMARKGRAGQRGEKSSQAKLTEQSVREIRAAVDGGEPAPIVAQRYGVTRGLVSGVARRVRWRHVV